MIKKLLIPLIFAGALFGLTSPASAHRGARYGGGGVVYGRPARPYFYGPRPYYAPRVYVRPFYAPNVYVAPYPYQNSPLYVPPYYNNYAQPAYQY